MNHWFFITKVEAVRILKITDLDTQDCYILQKNQYEIICCQSVWFRWRACTYNPESCGATPFCCGLPFASNCLLGWSARLVHSVIRDQARLIRTLLRGSTIAACAAEIVLPGTFRAHAQRYVPRTRANFVFICMYLYVRCILCSITSSAQRGVVNSDAYYV